MQRQKLPNCTVNCCLQSSAHTNWLIFHAGEKHITEKEKKRKKEKKDRNSPDKRFGCRSVNDSQKELGHLGYIPVSSDSADVGAMRAI